MKSNITSLFFCLSIGPVWGQNAVAFQNILVNKAENTKLIKNRTQ